MPKTLKPPLRGGVGAEEPSKIVMPYTPPKPTGKQLQDIVTALLRKHGDNVPQWAEWAGLLAEFNLKDVDVTSDHLIFARDRVHEEIEARGRTFLNRNDFLVNVPIGGTFKVGDAVGVVLQSNSCSVRVALARGPEDGPKELDWAPTTMVENTSKKKVNGIVFPLLGGYNENEPGHNVPNTRKEKTMATKTAPKAKKNGTSKKKGLEEARPVKYYDKAEIVTLMNAIGMKTVDKDTKVKSLDGFLNKLNNPTSQEDLAKLDGDEELSALRDRILVDLNAGMKLTTAEIPEAPVKPAKGKGTANPNKAPKVSSNGNGRTFFRNADGSTPARGEGVVLGVHNIFIKATSQKNALSRDEAVEKLAKAFPDRDEANIRKTVSDYISWWSHKRYGFEVQHNADKTKFWVKAPAKTE